MIWGISSMGLTLGSIVVATLLVANALAILHEERFLSKWGWGYEQTRMDPTSIKAQISRLLYAFRVIMRVPLIILNILTIVMLLILG
ncbi:hypothetical protein GAYE_SCF48G6024 [Galdieria yellowstonensis]|uniref:Immediate early response 3-interacting protein 1 n=1 Tax=Galdieria yellowstonensis TaxID=3028027 RepID=A0AAV9IL23_9RHOD|nr:hypothetical protein GAYE_SCF48G6024 [Galdieria yellowstonensis]